MALLAQLRCSVLMVTVLAATVRRSGYGCVDARWLGGSSTSVLHLLFLQDSMRRVLGCLVLACGVQLAVLT